MTHRFSLRGICNASFFTILASTTLVLGEGNNTLGLEESRLATCPTSPNCVSTKSESQDHFIAPYTFQTSLEEAKAKLKKVLHQMSRTELVYEEDLYLHYEFTSFLFRFVDDVEFLFDESSKTIHFRSASRVGYSDFGANRKRMERIRKLLETNP